MSAPLFSTTGDVVVMLLAMVATDEDDVVVMVVETMEAGSAEVAVVDMAAVLHEDVTLVEVGDDPAI